MGIAVGVLMGSQAIGAAAGGLVASEVGSAHAIAGALAAAAVFSVWSAVSTPHEARHLRRPSRAVPPPKTTVVDLVAAEAARPSAEIR